MLHRLFKKRPRTIDGKPVPGQLTLAFSQAADYQRIDTLFTPALKTKMDPKSYVKKRYEPVFRNAITNGQAAFLVDKKGAAHTLTIAYRLQAQNNGRNSTAPSRHDYTELGTSLARIQGYKSAQLVIAALALKEWWENPPVQDIVADIKYENIPSVKIYHNALGWKPEQDSPALDGFFAASYATITDEFDQPCPPPDKEERSSITMHKVTPQAMAMMAQILLEYMKQGQLLNKHTKDTIKVDVSALDTIGLTKPRLQAIAGGQTDKTRLLQLC